jgi:DinB superfamily
MSDLHELRTRLRAAHERIAAAPETGPGVYGAPDPKTGERWNAGNVLGHTAEMLPFWVDQVRGVLAGRTELGRGVEGYERRKQGIESGATLGEEELRTRVEAGVSLAAILLDEMSPADLERRVTYRSRDGEDQTMLGQLVDQLIVGHLEEHAKQLTELT